MKSLEMPNETLDIDGNMWCIANDICMAEPEGKVGFGRTIKEAVMDYPDKFDTAILGKLPEDLEPSKRDGFVGVVCKETNIAFVGYNHRDSVMRVEYMDGKRYDYFDVPQDIWQKILVAESKGAMLNRLVKGNYRYCRRDGD